MLSSFPGQRTMSRKANEENTISSANRGRRSFHLYPNACLTPHARGNADDDVERPNKRAKVDNRDIADKVNLFSFTSGVLPTVSCPAPDRFLRTSDHCSVGKLDQSRGKEKRREKIPRQLQISGRQLSSCTETRQSQHVYMTCLVRG